MQNYSSCLWNIKKNIYYIIASSSKIHILFQVTLPPYIFLNRKKNIYPSQV